MATIFGDTSGSLTGAEVGGNQTINGTDYVFNFIYGDAGSQYGTSRGGDDYIIGGQGQGGSNLIFGDSNQLFDSATGGNDTIIGGNSVDNNTLVGDADSLRDHSVGGNDYIKCGDNVAHNFPSDQNFVLGDAAIIAGSAIAGNDTIIGGLYSTNKRWGWPSRFSAWRK